MQRLRSALPYFAENEWEVTVAAAPDNRHHAPRDPLLAQTVPPGTRVVYPRTWSEAACRKFGFGHLSYRTAIPWRWEILKLLRAEKFDLVFFTTTQAAVMANAPLWHRKTGVPYVIDLQDPICVPDGTYTKENAPGGHRKYQAARWLARFIERKAFRSPSAVVSTSAHYLEVLKERYPHLRKVPMETLPFAVPEQDLELLQRISVQNKIFSKDKKQKVVLYAGRGGPDLHLAMRAILRAVAQIKEDNEEDGGRLRLYFVGTSYGPAGSPRQVLPLGQECGCGEMVADEPDRRPYFEVLQASQEADAVLVLGSRSADYTASKALLTLAAARRVIAVVHRESLVHHLLQGHPQVFLCGFQDTPEEERCSEAIRKALRKILEKEEPAIPRPSIPPEYTAREMTRQLCARFDQAVGGN